MTAFRISKIEINRQKVYFLIIVINLIAYPCYRAVINEEPGSVFHIIYFILIIPPCIYYIWIQHKQFFIKAPQHRLYLGKKKLIMINPCYRTELQLNDIDSFLIKLKNEKPISISIVWNGIIRQLPPYSNLEDLIAYIVKAVGPKKIEHKQAKFPSFFPNLFRFRESYFGDLSHMPIRRFVLQDKMKEIQINETVAGVIISKNNLRIGITTENYKISLCAPWRVQKNKKIIAGFKDGFELRAMVGEKLIKFIISNGSDGIIIFESKVTICFWTCASLYEPVVEIIGPDKAHTCYGPKLRGSLSRIDDHKF